MCPNYYYYCIKRKTFDWKRAVGSSSNVFWTVRSVGFFRIHLILIPDPSSLLHGYIYRAAAAVGVNVFWRGTHESINFRCQKPPGNSRKLMRHEFTGKFTDRELIIRRKPIGGGGSRVIRARNATTIKTFRRGTLAISVAAAWRRGFFSSPQNRGDVIETEDHASTRCPDVRPCLVLTVLIWSRPCLVIGFCVRSAIRVSRDFSFLLTHVRFSSRNHDAAAAQYSFLRRRVRATPPCELSVYTSRRLITTSFDDNRCRVGLTRLRVSDSVLINATYKKTH